MHDKQEQSVILNLFGPNVMKIAPFVMTQTAGCWKAVCRERGLFEAEIAGFPNDPNYTYLVSEVCMLLARASSDSLQKFTGASKFSIQHTSEKYKVLYHDESNKAICSIEFESLSNCIKITTCGIDPNNLPVGLIISNLASTAKTSINASLLDAVERAMMKQRDQGALSKTAA